MSGLVSRRNLLIAAGAVLAIGAGAGVFATRDVHALEIGGPAPTLTVQDAQGRSRSLSEFAGQTVVLEWTNRGCPYVQRHYSADNMQETQRQAIAQGAAWLTVISSAPGEQGFLDGPAALAHARAVNAAPTAILLDPTGRMGRAFNALTTPHMFVLDAQGRVVYQGAIDDRPTARAGAPLGENYVLAALADVRAGRAVARAQTTPYGCSVKYAA